MSFGTHRATEGLDPSTLGVPRDLAAIEHVHEHVLYDAVEDRLPREPESEAWVFSGAIAPGTDTGWHVHSGTGYSVIVKGSVRMESEQQRAVNIAPDTVMVAVHYQAARRRRHAAPRWSAGGGRHAGRGLRPVRRPSP